MEMEDYFQFINLSNLPRKTQFFETSLLTEPESITRIESDATFEDLPFYDVCRVIIKPINWVPAYGPKIILKFHLRARDLRELYSNTNVRVLLRIGYERNIDEQEDEFSPSLCLRVNYKKVTLKNTVPIKSRKCPLDVTSFIKRSTVEQQFIHLFWKHDKRKVYLMGLFLVRKLNCATLIERLENKCFINSSLTKAMIRQKYYSDRDSEFATTFFSLRVSLLCPIGKTKMTLPCRGLTCAHLQCFDATLYVQMNEKNPKWFCPICDETVDFKNLAIDALFFSITHEVPSECTEVQFDENASWMPIVEGPVIPLTKTPKRCHIIDLDSDSDTEDLWLTVQPPEKKTYKHTEGVTHYAIATEPKPPHFSNVNELSNANLQPSCSYTSSAQPRSLLVCERNTSTPIFQDFCSLHPPAASTSFIDETPQDPPLFAGSFHNSADVLSFAGHCTCLNCIL